MLTRTMKNDKAEGILINQEYLDGYDAACLCEPRDMAKSTNWLLGYNAALRDMNN
jgi:hypothetical protein